MNLRNRKSYQYLQDLDDESNIEIIDSMTNLILDFDVDVHIPLVGDVAAGIPMTAIQHFEDTVPLPKDWLIDPHNTFALKVTGDSMIGADIDKGDIVIVHRQEAVNNGDIVIAVIGEEATMKKYMSMGSSILLISENPSYEQIQMNDEDEQINGKVIEIGR